MAKSNAQEKLWVTTFTVRVVSRKRVDPTGLEGLNYLITESDDAAGGWYKEEEDLMPRRQAANILERMGRGNCSLLDNGDDEGEAGA